MTGPEHSRRAEELLAEAQRLTQWGPAGRREAAIAEAQVHATLALAAGSPSRSGWYGWLVLLVAGIFAGLSIAGYNRLSHDYPAVTVAASTDNLGALQAMTLSAAGRTPVQWWQWGYVRQLDVTGPAEGTAEVTLPVPALDCQVMAAMLGTTCQQGNRMSISNSVMFSWSSPQLVTGSSGGAGLTIEPSLGPAGAPSLVMLPQTYSVPTACFGLPAPGATLTVTSDNHTFGYPRGGSGSWQETCLSGGTPNVGITVSVTLPEPGGGNGRPPVFDFGNVSELAVCA